MAAVAVGAGVEVVTVRIIRENDRLTGTELVTIPHKASADNTVIVCPAFSNGWRRCRRRR